jgi:aquaporin Z
MSESPSPIATAAAPATASEALRLHWRLYVDEGVELGLFMLAACLCTVILFGSGSAVARWVPGGVDRRVLMGLAMGATAVGIIHSPMGKRSGAHFNPAITLTYLRLGRIGGWDALGYIVGQFVGGAAGVAASLLLVGRQRLAQPSVEFAVTVPGIGGTAGAFAAEWFMATLLMGVVLWSASRPSLARWTSYMVGVLIVNYIFFFAPVSGFSINPARTVASAVFAGVWTAVWVYFLAPLLGMLGVAEVYLRLTGNKSTIRHGHRHGLSEGLPR